VRSLAGAERAYPLTLASSCMACWTACPWCLGAGDTETDFIPRCVLGAYIPQRYVDPFYTVVGTYLPSIEAPTALALTTSCCRLRYLGQNAKNTSHSSAFHPFGALVHTASSRSLTQEEEAIGQG